MFEVLVPYREAPSRWFAVDAVSLGGNLYRIVFVPDDAPSLRFGEGDRVECEQQTDDDGHLRLLARRVAAPTW
ncbi:MAG: hypothetical protein ACPG8O_10175 [Alcanivorax nanhaiticus]